MGGRAGFVTARKKFSYPIHKSSKSSGQGVVSTLMVMYFPFGFRGRTNRLRPGTKLVYVLI